ncbi:MAG: HAD hydrolase family protein [Longicatena sp.]
MEKKYFFFDIDGTLTDGKSFMGGIPQSTKDAIQELKKNGHEVAIATGRPYVAAKVFAKDAGIENVVCNGGYTCVLNGEIIANKGMELKDCHHLMQECLDKDIPFLVAYQDDFVFYTHNDTFFTVVNRDEFHADVKVIDNFDDFACPEIFRMMIAIDRGYEDKIEHYIKENSYAQTLHSTYYSKNPNFLNSTIVKNLGFKSHQQFKKDDIEERQKLVQRICEKIWSIEYFKNIEE